MKKVIVSSLFLRRKLKDADVDLAADGDEFQVTVQSKYLTIERVLNISVESKQDFEATISGRTLKRLSRICGMVEDQPIVLEFVDYNSINTSFQL